MKNIFTLIILFATSFTAFAEDERVHIKSVAAGEINEVSYLLSNPKAGGTHSATVIKTTGFGRRSGFYFVIEGSLISVPRAAKISLRTDSEGSWIEIEGVHGAYPVYNIKDRAEK